MYFLDSACRSCQRYAEGPRAVCVPAAGETATPQRWVPSGRRGASPGEVPPASAAWERVGSLMRCGVSPCEREQWDGAVSRSGLLLMTIAW